MTNILIDETFLESIDVSFYNSSFNYPFEISKSTNKNNSVSVQPTKIRDSSFKNNNPILSSPNYNYLTSTKEKRDEIILQYTNELRILIKQDEFIDGEISQSEYYMLDAYKQGELHYVIDAIMKLYSCSLTNVHMLKGILTIIACVPYEAIEPQGQIMAMGLLTHKSLSVRDKAIQCFEKWNSKKGLPYLKNIKCSPKWLQRYAEKVIMYIERDGIE